MGMISTVTRFSSLMNSLRTKEKNESPYALKEIFGKGEGMVASREIAYGHLILKEQPILKGLYNNEENIHKIVEEKFNGLVAEKQKIYMGLYDANKKEGIKTISGIFNTNRLSLCECEVAIFNIASKFNHSCNPNVGFAYVNPYLRLYATKRIKKGEELCISYVGKFKDFSARQNYLQMNWQFICSCDLCSMSIDERNRFEAKIKQYKILENELLRSCQFKKMQNLLHKMLKKLIDCRMLDPALKYDYDFDMFDVKENQLDFKIARYHVICAIDDANIIWGKDHWIVQLLNKFLNCEIDEQELRKVYQDNKNRCCCRAYRLR